MPVVELSNRKRFNCDENLSILESAQQANLTLEYSCRTGRCGVCKAHVEQGQTEILTPESGLDSAEIKQGYILTCCRTALSDIKLDIEDLGMLAGIKKQILPCRIDTIEHLSCDVIGITLRIPPTSQLDYLPGQYIDVIGSEGIRRSYSIANAPREDGKINLQIRKVEQGVMSRYWFETAKQNDLLRFEGPLGTFCHRETPKANLLFLATGTGIAPVKAMLEQMAKDTSRYQQHVIHVYWGGRTTEDLYWQPAFPGLNLRYVPVLSRQAKDWSGKTGYVQDMVMQDNIELSDTAVYACGSEAMIHSAQRQLVDAGLNAKYFYSDAFVSSN